ncbi:MAG: hypothetical protein ACOYNN_14555 [Terrimicrobiaceae bacterium]|jgi:hypothetical protein
MKQFTNEEIQKSVEMIRTILMNDMQWVDMIYNGDKDTLRESYELVIESEEGIQNATFDKDLFEKWKDRIWQTYGELTQYGKDKRSEYFIVEKYLENLLQRHS